MAVALRHSTMTEGIAAEPFLIHYDDLKTQYEPWIICNPLVLGRKPHFSNENRPLFRYEDFPKSAVFSEFVGI